jgi:hypothetical protein
VTVRASNNRKANKSRKKYIYDFKLRWASDEMTSSGPSDVDSAPSLSTALHDTLGPSERFPLLD